MLGFVQGHTIRRIIFARSRRWIGCEVRDCYFYNLCATIFLRDLWDQKYFKTFFSLVCYIDKSKKSDIKNKVAVWAYLTSIILYIINVWNPLSEYFLISEYYYIRTIMSWISWNLYKNLQMFSTFLQVCQFTPNYIRVKFARRIWNICPAHDFLRALVVHW